MLAVVLVSAAAALVMMMQYAAASSLTHPSMIRWLFATSATMNLKVTLPPLAQHPPTNPPSPPINCSAMQYNQQTQLHRSACNVTPCSEPTDLTLVEAEMRVVYEKYACDGFSWVV